MIPVIVGVCLAAFLGLTIRWVGWSFKQSVRQTVEETVAPLSARLVEHMANEEDAREEINSKLDAIHAQFTANEVAHVAFDERLRRLEKP